MVRFIIINTLILIISFTIYVNLFNNNLVRFEHYSINTIQMRYIN